MKSMKGSNMFSSANAMAASAIKPTNKTVPANRASLGVREIKGPSLTLPNRGK